jgi:aspartate aminotransferase-like enzyme
VKQIEPTALLCQHHETSTGQLYDLKKIATICKKYRVKLVVDAVSSFLTDPLDMDELGIDICVTSSQKGLNIPPGLAFVVLSADAVTETFARKGFYFDFSENLRNLERGQTPYSPATTLFLQLHARLKEDVALGCDNIIHSVRERAIFFRELCYKNHWHVPAEISSNCITGFFVCRNGDILFTELLKQDIHIMPSGTPNYFRVSHSGVQSKKDLSELAQRIQEIENR